MKRLFEFKPVSSSDSEELFALYKSALKSIVEETFGWDEAFQRERFKSRYDQTWFHWIEDRGDNVGFVCYWRKTNELHLSLLIIVEDKRNIGYGQAVMERLHAEARRQNGFVTLSSFRKNLSAIKFYEKLRYSVVGGDDHFVDMKLDAP